MSSVFLDTPHELLRARGISQIDGGELEAAIDKMRVPVRKPRHDESASGVEHLRLGTDVARQLSRVTHREDLAARNRDGAGLAAARGQTRPDRSTLDHEISLGATGGDERQRDYVQRTAHDEPPTGVW